MSKYILAIDQSTAGTKAILFNESAQIVGRSDLPHEQKISLEGWVSHDPIEIYKNVINAVKNVVLETNIDKNEIIAVGISNQRETALAWNRETGVPVGDAVVWQCSRGEKICENLADIGETIKAKTGLKLSPYFSAAKISWLIANNSNIKLENLAAGTIDSWLVYKLTGGKSFKTDYSNASRTQLFNILELKWDKEICYAFGIPISALPDISDSNAFFGKTDFEGFLTNAIPIQAVLGDSHAALFGQGCTEKGKVKVTYGTGSSVMMNIGDTPIFSQNGLVTSLAWGMNGKINYVLEGNINYAGSVIKWLVDDMGLIPNSKEAGEVAKQADQRDTSYLVPAFTGLGAPYFKSDAAAILCGMTRRTGRKEIVKAGEESIAYQIADIVNLMADAIPVTKIRVDGGATRDNYLMQFQSDILGVPVIRAENEELSAIGAAFTAGISIELYEADINKKSKVFTVTPKMSESERTNKYKGWKKAVNLLLG